MYRLTFAALALLLGGCERKPGEARILAAADRLAEPLPGLYRSTTTFESFELPGAQASEAQVASDRMTRLSPQVKQFCLTPEEAKGGFRRMLSQMQDGDCSIEKFDIKYGALDARMRCDAASGIVSTIVMHGEADPQSSKVALDMEQRGDAVPGGTARMRMTVENVRTGDCQDAGVAGTGGN